MTTSGQTGIALEMLARDGTLWAREASSSMAPLLRPGDWVRLDPFEPAAAFVGMLVAYRSADRIIVHRMLAWNATGFVAKGDALPSPDLIVPWGRVVGRVAARRRPDGRIVDLRRFPWPALDGLLGRVATLAGRLCGHGADGTASPARRPFWRMLRLPFHVLSLLVR
jgi:hypothetical protein